MKSYLELLEDELKKMWNTHNNNGPIRGAHTEIEIEPKIFLGEELSPEMAKLLAAAYLSKTTIDDVNRGKLEITDHALVIKDQDKKPVAIIRSQIIIQKVKDKFGLE